MNNLAVGLAEVGRRAEGWPPRRPSTCVGSWSSRTASAYLPDLARSVNNLAVGLAEVGRRAEGLAAAEEAVDRWPAGEQWGPRQRP